MASQADYFKVEKKKKETPEPLSAREAEARSGKTSNVEDYVRANERQKSQTAVGAAVLQEKSANEGTYAGLGLAERAAAERMVRSGEAKNRDEAAAAIRKKKAKPPAAAQAGALEKP